MKRGFTLLELMITMGFITTISLMLTTVYVVGMKTYQQELATSTVQSDGQTILDTLTTDAKNGVSIDATHGVYTTDDNTIIIRVPAIDNARNVLYSGTDMRFDVIIYDYTNNEIHRVIYADPASYRYKLNGQDITLSKNILSLSFSYDPDAGSATKITASISSKVKIGNQVKTINLMGQARLRNHI